MNLLILFPVERKNVSQDPLFYVRKRSSWKNNKLIFLTILKLNKEVFMTGLGLVVLQSIIEYTCLAGFKYAFL